MPTRILLVLWTLCIMSNCYPHFDGTVSGADAGLVAGTVVGASPSVPEVGTNHDPNSLSGE